MSSATENEHAQPSDRELERKEKQERPVRAGVFDTLESAEHAVSKLRESGFSDEEITVVCSDEVKEKHFKQNEHQQPAGTNTPAATVIGGTVGASLFGLTTFALGAATANVPLMVAGGWGIWTGGILGGFVGAMMTRGIEKEAANFYDQAVVAGKILVVAEDHGPRSAQRLLQAEYALHTAGAEPVALPEG
jgi:hypothetical protein